MSSAGKPVIKRKRESLDDFGEFLGKGTFAFVVASRSEPERYVYRIGVLKNTPITNVQREVFIQRFLNKKEISPCFPAIFGLEFFDGPDEIENDAVRERLEELGDWPFFVVKMERGTAGDMETPAIEERLRTDMDFFRTTYFMLVWSVWVANSQFGFRHRDIKPANIVFKKLDEPTVFNFKVKGKFSFTVKTDMVPLLIDYGFASLLTTREFRRYTAGTVAYYPPEIFCRMMVFGKVHAAVSASAYHYEDTFDLWGIAASLLSALHGSSTFGGGTTLLSVLVEMMSFMAVAHGQPAPPKELFANGIYSPYLFGVELKKAERMMDRPKYEALVRKYPERVELLKYFLRWDPFERAIPDFYNQLEIMFFDLKGESNAAEVIYRNEALPFFERNSNEEFREAQFQALADVKYIRARACETCESAAARFVCTCCAKVLCDEGCHN